jgi:hypothetical protein
MPKNIENRDSDFSNANNGEDSAIEFKGKKIFRIVRPSDRVEYALTVEDVVLLKTKFGDKLMAVDHEGNAIFLNQTIINKLLGMGIDKSNKLKGKTLYLEARDIFVRGLPKKMYDLKGVE